MSNPDEIFRKVMNKDYLLKVLKWYRDDYISPNQFLSTIDAALNESARYSATNTIIEYMECGKHTDSIISNAEAYMKMIRNITLLYEENIVSRK